jgi:hypothetical protein
MRMLAGLSCVLFFALGLGLLFLLLVSTAPMENTDPPSALDQLGLGLVAIGFFIAAICSAGYARVPTQLTARRAVISAAVAGVPFSFWFLVSAATNG